MIPYSPVLKLSSHQNLAAFDCGEESLNVWLKRYALVNQQNGSAQTFVVCRGSTVVGYFAIATGSVRPEEAPERMARGLARHPIPVALLARLAVDVKEQGKGLGRALLKDALLRIEHAASLIGIRAVLVEASNPKARKFYETFGFVACPADDLKLMLLLKDIRAIS